MWHRTRLGTKCRGQGLGAEDPEGSEEPSLGAGGRRASSDGAAHGRELGSLGSGGDVTCLPPALAGTLGGGSCCCGMDRRPGGPGQPQPVPTAGHAHAGKHAPHRAGNARPAAAEPAGFLPAGPSTIRAEARKGWATQRDPRRALPSKGTGPPHATASVSRGRSGEEPRRLQEQSPGPAEAREPSIQPQRSRGLALRGSKLLGAGYPLTAFYFPPLE